jgi:proline utilization trans-activator
MTLAHGKVFGTTLPNANLRFDGVAYDLGWDGRRTAVNFEQTALPTADFALFLINAVKFHCGQLYHVFDEQLFMHYFGKFHEGANGRNECPDLWHVHYLLVLALGKALMGRTGTEGRPPGADLFVQGMKLLPDSTFLWTDPLQSTEVLCCAALYLQCLDMRIAAYNIVSLGARFQYIVSNY